MQSPDDAYTTSAHIKWSFKKAKMSANVWTLLDTYKAPLDHNIGGQGGCVCEVSATLAHS